MAGGAGVTGNRRETPRQDGFRSGTSEIIE